MFEKIIEMFEFAFIVRALVVGALVSICAALLGVPLVLKRYSMIGSGLSNVGFGSLALATALNLSKAPLTVAIPIVIAAAFLLLRLSENSKIKGDAAVALLSTGSLAVGVIIISKTTGMNTDVCNYLFGSILAMAKIDVYLSIALSVVVMLLFVLFYNKLFAITFDETFAKSAGIKTGIYNMLIALLTALTIVLGMRIMGAMLISSLIIFPALSSMRIFKKFKSVTISSAVISILCFFTGIVISYTHRTPTGASVVLINIIVFVIFWIIAVMCNLSSVVSRKIIRSKAAAALAVVIVLSVVISGCKGKEKEGSGIVEIGENMFIAQVNDVYLNPRSYFDKTIKLEGIFFVEKLLQSDQTYYYVLRYGPGCCGNDGNVGFEVRWDKEQPTSYPPHDAWVEATGSLKVAKEGNLQFLYLDLESLQELSTRGAETVAQ